MCNLSTNHWTLPTVCYVGFDNLFAIQLDFRDGVVSYNSYLGTRDVDCQNFELSYVSVNSEQLANKITGPVRAFAEGLLTSSKSSGEASGYVCLEFSVNRKGTWGLGSEPSIWERWTINVTVKPLLTKDRDVFRQQLSEQFRDELLGILAKLNSPNSHMPSLGSSQLETEHIIDFSIPDISPYRFTIHYNTNPAQGRTGMGYAARRLLKYN